MILTICAYALLCSSSFGQFSLGVAAGDVTENSAILWTRADEAGSIAWELSNTPDFNTAVVAGLALADPAHDLTIKIDLSGLDPATEYWYRFHASLDSTVQSTTGHFRTAPDAATATPVRFVFSGDTSFAFAPFPAMAGAADEGADFLIWFGDTIYGDVEAAGLGPATTLDDYRAKYRQIRSDPNAQKMLAGMAMWTGWDDHEIKNNYAGLDPSLSAAQRDAAYQAFFEYMPVRNQQIVSDPTRTYRRFGYGTAADFFMLDERQYRDVSAADDCGNNPDPLGFAFGALTLDRACRNLLYEPRQMLGPSQLDWLKNGLLHSTARLKFVVNNVPLMHIGVLPYDRWDGYDAQRKDLFEFVDANRIEGVVFLTTDIHANAFNPDLASYFRRHRTDYAMDNGVRMAEIIAGPFGNETLKDELLGEAGAVLHLPPSPVSDSVLGALEVQLVNKIKIQNHLLFIDEDRVGYAVIDVTAEGVATVTYRGVSNDGGDPPAMETTYSGPVVPAPSPLPCGSPIFALVAMTAWFATQGFGGRRAPNQQDR